MSEYLMRQKDTCTACGGTMLLEMAALSRLTGNPVYEQKVFRIILHALTDLLGKESYGFSLESTS